MSRAPRLPKWLVVLFALTFVGELVYLFALPLVERVRPIPDDSFFFLQVALRFWEGSGFTFDGQAETYGFQPLWQLLLIGMAVVLSTPQALFAGALGLCTLLHVTTGWRLYRLGERAFGPVCGAVAALFWTCNPAIMVWCWGLKENALYALLLVVGASQLLHLLQRVTWRRAAAFGVVLGLMVFNRVNALMVVGILLTLLGFAPRLGGGIVARLRAAALAAMVAVLIAAPWYLYAQWHFGTALPTSGTWKLRLMELHVQVDWQTPWMSLAHGLHALGEWPHYLNFTWGHGYGLFRPVLVALTAVGSVLAVVRWLRSGATRPVAALLVGAGLIAAALTTSFANQMLLPKYLGYADWYAVPEFVVIPLVAGALATALAPSLRKWLGWLVLAMAIAGAWWWVPPQLGVLQRHQRGLLTQPPRHMQLLEMGLWAGKHLPDDRYVGIWDPGIVSYFAGKRFVSFDPLMNSLDYQQREIFDPLGYIEKRDIAYMFGVAYRVGDRWQYVPLPAGSFEIVWLPYPDHEVGFSGPSQTHYVIVRPLDSPVPAFLTADDFPFGELYPNDPKRRRRLTGDRDRLVGGEAVASDVLRLWLDVPAGGADLEVRAGQHLVDTFAAGTRGFCSLDVRAWRGDQLKLNLPGGDLSAAVTQAHLLDFSW